MTKSELKKLKPKLVIIEGFWKVGKSALIREILKRHPKIFLIPEPNHLNRRNIKDPHEWYLKQHLNRHKQAKRLLGQKNMILMERSILANAAFYYAKHGKISDKYLKLLKISPELDQGLLVFLYADKKFCQKAAKVLGDRSVKQLIKNQPNFYQRYLDFYKKQFKKITGNEILCINVAPKGKFVPTTKIVSLVEKGINNYKHKKIVKEICASVIIFHENKILLLYDKNWHHYVLPQGHKERGENITKTAIRETIEETGFNNLKLIKKLGSYDYYYPVKQKIVNKVINVYLVKAITLNTVKKNFKGNENYINKFLDFNKSLKLAKWSQDKLFINRAIKIIKSPRGQ